MTALPDDLGADARLNVLSTIPTTTSWMDYGGTGQKRQERVLTFLDFTIDGVPLRNLATGRLNAPHRVQEMTRLCELAPWTETAADGLLRLLQRDGPDFDDGRVALLVCPIDADLGCRALSATIVWSTATVEWRDLGWQVSYEPFLNQEDAFQPALSFRFERSAYVALLGALLAHFEQLAALHAAEGASSTRRHRFWHRRS